MLKLSRIAQLKGAYWRAEPFQPFEIHMSDGRVFKIASPDTLLITPNNEIIVWIAEQDAFVRLNALHITSVTGTPAHA